MRTVLMLSYHYPPLGGSGSMRVLRFTRYLPEHGWKPVVVSVAGGANEPRDPGLVAEVPPEAEVHRVPCLEPDDYADTWDRPAQKVVRNLFKTIDFLLVPDERAFWIGPAARAAARLARQSRAEVVWATGPPFSTLLAGLEVHRRTGLPLVADFRDDWTGFNARFRSRSPARQAREERMEREVVEAASRVVSVTPGIVEALRGRRPAGVPEDRFQLLPNGFDPAHFPPDEARRSQDTFLIVHAGSLYSHRSPAPFLDGFRTWLDRLPEARESSKVRLLGRLEPALEPLLRAPGVDGLVEHVPFVPHRESLAQVRGADLLLLIVDQVEQADQIYTGKVFEYLGSGRPILALVPPGSPLATMLEESGSAYLARPDDPGDIAAALDRAWLGRADPPKPRLEVLERFDARALSGRLARLLEEACR